MGKKKRWGAVITAVAAITLVVLMISVLFPLPKAVVVSATIPGTTMNPGDTAIIYRFVVSAEGADVKMEEIYLTFSGGAFLENLHFYDDDSGTELSGALYHSSEGIIRYWPGWPLGEKVVIPKGTAKIFSLRGKVIGNGTVSIGMRDLVIERGSVEGLPSVIITLTVK